MSSPESKPQPGDAQPGEREAEKERRRAVRLMKRFFEVRAEALDFFMQLKQDARGTILKFSTLVPEDKEPLEGLTDAFKGWVQGAFEELAASVENLKRSTPQGALDSFYAVAHCIGGIQDSIFSGDGDERRRCLELLKEMGAGSVQLEGISLPSATTALLEGASAPLADFVAA